MRVFAMFVLATIATSSVHGQTNETVYGKPFNIEKAIGDYRANYTSLLATVGFFTRGAGAQKVVEREIQAARETAASRREAEPGNKFQLVQIDVYENDQTESVFGFSEAARAKSGEGETAADAVISLVRDANLTSKFGGMHRTSSIYMLFGPNGSETLVDPRVVARAYGTPFAQREPRGRTTSTGATQTAGTTQTAGSTPRPTEPSQRQRDLQDRWDGSMRVFHNEKATAQEKEKAGRDLSDVIDGVRKIQNTAKYAFDPDNPPPRNCDVCRGTLAVLQIEDLEVVRNTYTSMHLSESLQKTPSFNYFLERGREVTRQR